MENSRRREIESAFYNYEKNKKESAEYVSDLCSVSSPVLENIGRGSGIKNPTEINGIKLAEYKKYLWCEVVERTCTTFKFEYEYELIKRQHFRRMSHNAVIRSLNISPRTYYYWADKILMTAENWAYELRLFPLKN